MTQRTKYRLLIIIIAMIWLVNGFFCKVLGLVPRHEEIVASILGLPDARLLTVLIGLAETVMAAWILSGAWSRYNAVVQIVVIATMNILEFILVPELLLWGRLNAVFAFLLIVLIYYAEFYLKPKPAIQT